MNCLNNLVRTPIPGDVFMMSLSLYFQMGKNDYYEALFRPDEDFMFKQMALEESYAFYKCFFIDHKILESRMRTLQLDSTVPKNKSEQLYKNIIKIFQTIHQSASDDFHLNTTEIYDLAKLLFYDFYPSEKISYKKIERHKHSLISSEVVSKREHLEELINKLEEIKKLKLNESVFLYISFMVDFINMDIFKFEETHVLGILIFYLMIMQEGVIALNYVSFFQKLYLNIKEFNVVLDKSKFGWSEGYSEMMPLCRFILKNLNELYQSLFEKARDYEYESNLEISKSDYIENTIDKLAEVFSKDDIRLKHPLISDSTINRTLKRLQQENKIRPLGKGRSAKWIKLYKKEKKSKIQEQLNFDLGD
ncbi:MAG: hypothetical protein PHC62_05275 [Candidatus Izemoplasmatales bacterium]|nr:hypothetical protein [Candidatus Izemoplasmatales bacterium]